jgi:mitogen-activated protein kinase organizer 1
LVADGSYCLSGGYDKTIKLWNPYKGTRIREYLGHGYQVLGIAVYVAAVRRIQGSGCFAYHIFRACGLDRRSHDNSQIGSCGGDKQPILWDVSTGTVIKRFQGHDSQVNSIAFNEESTVMVTGGNDQMAKCWDAKSKHYAPIQTLDDAKDSVSCVLIRGHEIMTGYAGTLVQVKGHHR